MKQLTCRDLGGPCDATLTGETFQEIGAHSHAHVMEAINSGDAVHQEAANRMKNASLEEQQSMMAAYERTFNEAPEM